MSLSEFLHLTVPESTIYIHKETKQTDILEPAS